MQCPVLWVALKGTKFAERATRIAERSEQKNVEGCMIHPFI